MDDLLAYLERISPGYTSQFVGLEEHWVAHLEEGFGQRLPEGYWRFAATLGKSGGPLLDGYALYAPLDLKTLYMVEPRDLAPRRFFPVLYDVQLAPSHFWIDLEQPSEDDDREVVSFPSGAGAWERRARAFASLREMLVHMAAHEVHLPRFRARRSYVLDPARAASDREPTSLAALERVLRACGFERRPELQHGRLYERGDAALVLYRPIEGEGFRLDVGFQQQVELARFGALLADHTTLKTAG